MNRLSRLAFFLGSWANLLPTATRKTVYRYLKVASGVATVALLVLPQLPGLGLSLPTAYLAPVTLVLSLVAHLADRNTQVVPQVDLTPAPEGGNPVPPAPVEPPTPPAA